MIDYVPSRSHDDANSGLVSVIIPCHNQAHFLAEAIDSVFAQTYPHVEILVIDDGSTDNTAQVAASSPGVHYIRQENQGLSAARNTGLRHSTGSYSVFLDADDRLLPEALESGLHCLNVHPECAFVAGRYRLIAADGSLIAAWQGQRVESDHYVALLQRNYIAMHATVMYRRAVLESVGGFDTSLHACEDYDLYLRIARRFPIACHDTVVAEYRQHDTNMARDAARMLSSALTVLRAQWTHVKGNTDYERAYKIGRRFWQNYYGQQLTKQVRAHLETRAWTQALSETLVLGRYAPRSFAEGFQRLPMHLCRWLGVPWPHQPRLPVGRVRFGNLRWVTPFSRQFGFDRGQPIDRYYIENFLARYADDIWGHVLEIGDNDYTRRFGESRVTTSDVLHVAEGHPEATIVADLTNADHIPSSTFDCIIFTQTLHLIYDIRAAIRTLYRILKPGGVLLATVPGISQISDDEWADSWYWSFTVLSTRRLFEETFAANNLMVEAHGNVLTATAFLRGLAAEELRQEELDYRDTHYQVLITLRAVKSEGMQ